MWARLLYGFCFSVVMVGLYVKGDQSLHTIRAGRGATVDGLLDLAFILLLVALLVIAGRALITGRVGSTRTGAEDISPRGQLQSISGAGPLMFSQRPILTSLMTLLLFAIPFALMIIRAGGWSRLGQGEWIIIGIAELPLVFVMAVAFMGSKARGEPPT